VLEERRTSLKNCRAEGTVLVKQAFLAPNGTLLKAVAVAQPPLNSERTWPCLCGGVIHRSALECKTDISSHTLGACKSCRKLFDIFEVENLEGTGPVTVVMERQNN